MEAEIISVAGQCTRDEFSFGNVDFCEDLGKDALGEIFKRLPFECRLGILPVVCKRWRDVALDPEYWTQVDMQGWFQRRADRELLWEFESESMIERLIVKCVDLSGGLLKEFRATHCSGAAVEYLAKKCPLLQVLAIPNSHSVTDQAIKLLADNCPNLQELDVSDCYSISDQALGAVGRNCPSMIWLRRNMLQKEIGVQIRPHSERKSPAGGDDEAVVVARHMVNLKHLEMKRTQLSDRGLTHLAQGCKQLTTLNLACCMDLSERALAMVSENCPNILEFTKPITPRMHVPSQRLKQIFG